MIRNRDTSDAASSGRDSSATTSSGRDSSAAASGGSDTPRRTGQPPAARRAAIYIGLALLIFLLGLIPMWMKARENASQRDAARRELHLSRLQGTLAAAAIDARRGEYEPARQAASDFFTDLSGQIKAGNESALNASQREAVTPLLARRDDIITLLARSDPASADRLSDLYVAYRQNVVGATQTTDAR